MQEHVHATQSPRIGEGSELKAAGFSEIAGGGKGSHRKFTHARYRGAVTLSGQDGGDAKPYQEKQVQRAIDEVEDDDENK